MSRKKDKFKWKDPLPSTRRVRRASKPKRIDIISYIWETANGSKVPVIKDGE